MKTILTLFFLLLLPVLTSSQKNVYWDDPTKLQVDSFKSHLENEASDLTRMYWCRQLGLYYHEINTDSSLYYLEKQLLLAQKLHVKIWEAEAFSRIGYVQSIAGNYPGALKSLLRAVQLAGDSAGEKNLWQLTNFPVNGNGERARQTVLASTIHNMGHLYGFTGNYQQQAEKYFETEKIAAAINDLALLSLLNMNLGECYMHLHKLDSALLFERKALAYANTASFKKYVGLIFYVTGNIYQQKANIDSAEIYYHASVEINKQQSNLLNMAEAEIALANLYLVAGETDSSFRYAQNAVQILKSSGDKNFLTKAFTSLSKVYQAKHQIDSAFMYQQMAVDLRESTNPVEKIKQFQAIGFNEQIRLSELEADRIQNANRNRTYTLIFGVGMLLLITFLLFNNNRNIKKLNVLLQKQKDEIQEKNKNIEDTLVELKATQSQLIQAEKMASLGELTAGIAHEIQNPLNFINNFAEINSDIIDEIKNEIGPANKEANAMADDIKRNNEKIAHHGKRADSIIKGMLQHSRKNTGQKEPTDLNVLVDECLRLSYHGLRAADKSFNASFSSDLDPSIGKINIVPQDIGRVLLNLFNNSFFAVTEKKEQLGNGYEPTLNVCTVKKHDAVLITIRDNGNGVPANVREKIFQPFFTTKPTGKGTGLGLSISYEIITKLHGGKIKIDSKEGDYTIFLIELPVA